MRSAMLTLLVLAGSAAQSSIADGETLPDMRRSAVGRSEAAEPTVAASVDRTRPPVEARRLPEGAVAVPALSGGWVWTRPSRRPGPVPADLGRIVEPQPDPVVAEQVRREERTRQRLRKALATGVDLDFDGAPLREVLKTLGKRIDLQLQFDEQGIIDEGGDLDDPVSVSLTDVSAKTAFDFLFRPKNLVLTVRGEVVWVTTKYLADETLETRVYPIDDLTWVVRRDGRAELDFTPLLRTIQEQSSGNWDEIDGIGGRISVFETGGLHVFVVRQTCAVHEEIAELLYRLRLARTKAAQPALRNAESPQ